MAATKDFTGTTNPESRAAGFPTDCTLCHTTTNWTASTFNHNTTSFPLTGAHTTVACASCHVNNNYTDACRPTATPATRPITTGPPIRPHVASRFPDDLRSLPQHHQLDDCDVQSQRHVVPADRRARHRGLRLMPRQQQLHHSADRLLSLPHQGFHRHYQSESRHRGIPDQLRAVPHHHRPGRPRPLITRRCSR